MSVFDKIEADFAIINAALSDHSLLWLPAIAVWAFVFERFGPLLVYLIATAINAAVFLIGGAFMMIVNFKASRSRREMARRGWE